MKNQQILILTSIFIISSLVSCERNWNNPYDDAVELENWRPKYLQCNMGTLKSVTLSWYSGSSWTQGFKVDRYSTSGDYITAMATLDTNQTYFTDTTIDMLKEHYTYFVYAYFEDKISAKSSVEYNFVCGYDSIKDSRDGNIYSSVQIGNVCWMGENLKFLPRIYGPDSPSDYDARYYVYGFSGDNVSDAAATENYQTYGVLYNYWAALKSCPEGWYLSEIEDWAILRSMAGGDINAGAQLKEMGINHWDSPNTGATDIFGFSALPGGAFYPGNGFQGLRTQGGFWNANSNFYRMSYDKKELDFLNSPADYANSVRCVKSKGY